ncbi:phage major capsid protein [Neorhizobium galegae]|uniref:phage major capsid protein n=1 Tax=Neorhizobium galegae TaxID=399 RepID=UPI000621E5EE|nr:phage major capsid protein [Neorhizobium galegae]MCQ1778325.1 phage major capsid protein [Neorhizobium galegae]MCQ1796701.1 phage major capsid protein [Neorhizobium galegae]CDZ27992.1 Phage major capsid protein, HK97 family [Neorhizobium galegae bv. officinalis]
MKHEVIEVRSALPIETREDDPLAAATAAVEELRTAADERHTAHQTEVRSLTERLAAMETRLNRPGTQQQEQTDEAAATERRAFLNYLRRGNQTSEAELRALTVANDQQAGYLAPAEVSSEMIREITEFSPIRQYATVRQTTAPSVKYPRRTGLTNAKWEGEIEEAEESTVTFGQTEIVAKRLTTYVDISNSLLMGSDGTAEAEVRLAFAEDFGKKESTAFVLGDGFKQPEGILTSTAVQYVPNGHATLFAIDAFISLMYSLPAQYRNRGVWLMNGTTLAAVRKLKDGQGNFLWQPAFQAGQPETLLGRPVAEAIDMPDVVANAFPIAFGDLATAYRIVDRQALGVLSDPYTQATRAITRMHGTRWVGGGVVQPAAIKKLKMATS